MQKISYNKEIKLLMEKQKIKIVRKNDEYSAEYQVGDVFQVDSTWYGGVNEIGRASCRERVLQARREYHCLWTRMSMCF